MAISFIGSAVGSSSPNTGTTVTLPGSMAVNDLILVAAGVGDTANNGMAAPTTGGYTDALASGGIYSNDTADCNLDVYYKFHNGSDTTVAFGAVGGTNASNAAVVMVFRGVALVADGGPFDTTPSEASGIDTSDADPPSHDHSGAAGVWTVAIGATGHTGTATATFTAPTNYTTNFAQRAHDDGTDILLGMGYRTNPADPENPGAFTAANIGTAANNAWAAVTISLEPAAEVITGSGTPDAQPSTMAGSGLSTSLSTDGAISAQASTLAATGLSSSSGTGVLLAQAAVVDGTGTAGEPEPITGTGVLNAQGSDVTSTGLSESFGLGDLLAQFSSIIGAGLSSSLSTLGTLAASTSQIVGVGFVGIPEEGSEVFYHPISWGYRRQWFLLNGPGTPFEYSFL